MKYARLKHSSCTISRISFGCANFGGIGSAIQLVGKGDSEDDAHKMLNTAYSFGINYFDTASTYAAGRSELILGRWIRAFGIPREKIVISSKIGASVGSIFHRSGLSQRHITREVERSLKRLHLDYLDLLYIHTPDPGTPIVETLAALNEMVDRGMVRKLGASNIDVNYLRQSLEVSRANSFVEYEVVQNSYNFLDRKDEKAMIPFCAENDIRYIGYGPLSGGLLSGKYRARCSYPKNSRLDLRSELYRSLLNDDTFSTIDGLKAYAEQKKCDLPTLMYAWLYDKAPVDAFLIGARNVNQFQSVMAATNIGLSPRDWEVLDRMGVDARPELRANIQSLKAE